jgi:hypothetical protein
MTEDFARRTARISLPVAVLILALGCGVDSPSAPTQDITPASAPAPGPAPAIACAGRTRGDVADERPTQPRAIGGSALVRAPTA